MLKDLRLETMCNLGDDVILLASLLIMASALGLSHLYVAGD